MREYVNRATITPAKMYKSLYASPTVNGDLIAQRAAMNPWKYRKAKLRLRQRNTSERACTRKRKKINVALELRRTSL